MSETSPKINEDELYGRFNRSVERREQFRDLALRKASNLPLFDGVAIASRQETHNRGVSLWQAAVVFIVLLALGGAIGAGIMRWSASVPPAKPQEYRVRFWAEDGTELQVEP